MGEEVMLKTKIQNIFLVV